MFVSGVGSRFSVNSMLRLQLEQIRRYSWLLRGMA